MSVNERLDPPLVGVQFRAGSEPTYGREATSELARRSDVGWSELERIFPGLQVLPIFERVSKADIEALIRRGRRLTPACREKRFFAMFRVQLPPRSEWRDDTLRETEDVAAALTTLLLEHLPIERVTVEQVLAPLPISDGAAGVAQGHLDPPPKGLGVAIVSPAGAIVGGVWALSGGMGQGEIFADVERDWYERHPDFFGPPTPPPNLLTQRLPGGDQVPTSLSVQHGTSVLGVVAARLNTKHGLGVAPLVGTALLSSVVRVAVSPNDVADAIMEALNALAAVATGRVLLIEVQRDISAAVGASGPVVGPCETDFMVYEVIQFAVDNHVIVVEPAGNGGPMVTAPDGPDLGDWPLLHGDSGAILVGQSIWDSATGHVPAPQGCRGRRIDCFGWGGGVNASSSDYLGTTADGVAHYSVQASSGFGGTSAAAAMIAGAAIVVQAMVRASATGLGYLPPAQMRALLGDRSLGANTPLASGETDVIGVMPDLQQIAARLGLLPDLYIRDNIGDHGGAHDGLLWRSPDIIVRTMPLGMSPDAAFGESSLTENNVNLSEPPVQGSPAELYVRVRNRGGTLAAGAKVTVYYAKPATLLQPWLWTRIGDTLVDVPQGNAFAVAGPIPWTTVPSPGHYCFIATVEHVDDGLFTPGLFANFTDFKSYIRVKNNVAWRNFNVIMMPASGSIMALAADVTGPEEGDCEEMEFRVEAHLPAGSSLEIDIPEALAVRMSLPDGAFKVITSSKVRRGRLQAAGLSLLGSVQLMRREVHAMKLRVKVPVEQRHQAGEVALIQLHGGHPLGRVTWRLTPPATE